MHLTPEKLRECLAADDAVDTQPGAYYVSALDHERSMFQILSGPYETHYEALDKVPAAKRIAQELDPRGVWYSYGTCRIEPDKPHPPGVFQRMGYPLDLSVQPSGQFSQS